VLCERKTSKGGKECGGERLLKRDGVVRGIFNGDYVIGIPAIRSKATVAKHVAAARAHVARFERTTPMRNLTLSKNVEDATVRAADAAARVAHGVADTATRALIQCSVELAPR
jgi:hypothetical protein